MSDLSELIERLEKAEGPDYDLSQAIGDAVGAQPRYQHPGSERQSHLHYTASIDAALSLVPEGWWVETIGQSASITQRWLVRLGNADRGPVHSAVIGTPALALTIAALKARTTPHE